MTVEDARREYSRLAALAQVYGGYCERYRRYGGCHPCGQFHGLLDAASIVADMAVAEHWAGREPDFYSRRFIAYA